MSADTQIGPAVVKAVAVNMVNQQPIRRIGNQTVHNYIFAVLPSAVIKVRARLAGVPFVFAKPIVVGFIDDSDLAASNWD